MSFKKFSEEVTRKRNAAADKLKEASSALKTDKSPKQAPADPPAKAQPKAVD